MLLRWPKIYHHFLEKLSKHVTKANLSLWEANHKESLRSSLQINQYQRKFYGIWGSAKTTKEVETKLNELINCKESLLLIGERGTGRQMFAWYLHKSLFGEKAPFVMVDGSRFEHEWGNLFADQASAEIAEHYQDSSLLDITEGGTLFIREINKIPSHTQVMLAETMKNNSGKCLVIGCLQNDPQDEPSDMPQSLVPELLEVIPQRYHLTPLCERKRDIPFLAQGILEKLAKNNNRKTPMLSQEAVKLLLSHNYRQGNVSELIQVIERAFYITDSDIINLEHIFFGPPAEKIGRSIDLLTWPHIANFFKKQTVLQEIRVVGFILYLAVLALLLFMPGAAITTRIFGLLWGLWWPALAIFSPLLGRIWCTVCPFAFLMDLVQKKWHYNKIVPDWLKKYDYLLITGLFLLVFWIEIVTQIRTNPTYTLILLLGLQAAAVIFGIVFTRHTWCRHICPLGGFIGMASIGSLLEIRADSTVCLNKCTTFNCYTGSELPGCPMSQHLPFLDNNLGCKLCFNCVRNCPNGAVKFNLRIPAREVWHLIRVDQGFIVFIGSSLGILIPVNYFEPLQGVWPFWTWFICFTSAYWLTALLAGLIIWFIAKPFKTKAASVRIRLVFAFIPLIIAGYVIYQLPYMPGIHNLLIGLGIRNSATDTKLLFFSALKIAEVCSLFIGAVLTALTILMVILRRPIHHNGH